MEAEAVHVLIVEEDAAERDRVRRSLGEMGHGLTVSEASTLSEATAVLEHAHIDVVLLAMNIGGEPGLALCTDRERSRNPSVAFIVLAEENDAQRAREALHQGAHDYLVKGEAPPRAVRRAVRYARERGRAEHLQQRLLEAERHQSLGRVVLAVAHEINNPSSWALNNLELIGEVAADALALVEAGEPESVALSALRELQPLVSDGIAGMHRIRRVVHAIQEVAPSGDQPRSRVALAELLSAAEATLAPRARAQSACWTFEVSAAGAVVGDRAALLRALYHLITNALQAVEGRSGPRDVSVVAWSEGEEAHIEVSDSGAGIHAEHAARLFQPFFTTSPSDERLGLGLWSVSEIARAHGGRVVHSPRPGGGSRFTLSLPLADPEAPPAGGEPPPPTSRRILLIDDEPLALRLMARILGRGWPVVTARSGAEAIQILEADADFGLILTDLLMPTIDGLALYQWITSSRPALSKRVCALTGGKVGLERVQRLRAAGVTTLLKPATSEELRALAFTHCGPPSTLAPHGR
jgi:two-component system NtrC family sensor kinase